MKIADNVKAKWSDLHCIAFTLQRILVSYDSLLEQVHISEIRVAVSGFVFSCDMVI